MLQYPKPLIPLKPVLAWDQAQRKHVEKIPSVLDAGKNLAVTSGRVAIAIALRHAGIKNHDEVLIPAYHCTALVEPVVWSQAVPVFYRIHKNTSIDLDDIKAKFSDKTRALIIIHYFGFNQKIDAIRDFCKSRGIVLIEDCAHSFFGQHAGQSLGSFGDYAIASAMKFFPIFDGGLLISSRFPVDEINVQSGSWEFQLKSAFNSLEYILEYKETGATKFLLNIPIKIKQGLWSLVKSKQPERDNKAIGPGASEGDYKFDPGWINTRMSAVSKTIIRLSDLNSITDLRRQNYQTLHHALSQLSGCQPLYQDLPASTVPYVLPILMDEPEHVFPILKRNGVPILRFGEFLWEGIDKTVCPVSVDLSRRLFQFPCHQGLTADQLEWMVSNIQGALS